LFYIFESSQYLVGTGCGLMFMEGDRVIWLC